MMVVRLFFSAFLLSGYLAHGAVVSNNVQSSQDATELTLRDSLIQGASVYICSIISRHSVSTNPSAEAGTVSLSTHATLYGTKTDKIVVSYSFSRQPGPLSWTMVWPNLEQMHSNEYLLCVIVPNSRDPAFVTPEVSEAASYVRVVRNENDESVKEIQAICKLYENRNSTNLKDQVEFALSTPEPELRQCALEMAVMDLGPQAPSEAIHILQSHIQMDWIQLKKLIFYIKGKMGRQGTTEKEDRFFLRCVAELAESENQSVRETAIRVLKDGVVFYHRPPSFLKEAMPDGEKQRLQKLLDIESKSTNSITSQNASTLRKWLKN